MIPEFLELLDNLVSEHIDDYPMDEIISAFELKLYALKEEQEAQEKDAE